MIRRVTDFRQSPVKSHKNEVSILVKKFQIPQGPSKKLFFEMSELCPKRSGMNSVMIVTICQESDILNRA